MSLGKLQAKTMPSPSAYVAMTSYLITNSPNGYSFQVNGRSKTSANVHGAERDAAYSFDAPQGPAIVFSLRELFAMLLLLLPNTLI